MPTHYKTPLHAITVTIKEARVTMAHRGAQASIPVSFQAIELNFVGTKKPTRFQVITEVTNEILRKMGAVSCEFSSHKNNFYYSVITPIYEPTKHSGERHDQN